MTDAIGLPALEARLRQDLDWLDLPWKPWLAPTIIEGREASDVVIIGGGMCGLAAAAQLKLLGIERIRVLDRAPEGEEGPWITYARMETLRSPKEQAGPALNLPALTFRAWFEAQFGTAAFAALYRAPRPMWMDYLRWYRRVMGVKVENRREVTLIRPRAEGLLDIEVAGQPTILARRLVLATGRDGLGGPALPGFCAKLPAHLHAHSSAMIDFAALRGRRVAVIGCGASAMDNAATALEAGCASMDMFIRRAAIPPVDMMTGFAGMVHGLAALPDEWKWRMLHTQVVAQNPPPRDSVLRVFRHANARLHVGCPVLDAEQHGDGLRLITPRGAHDFDFLVLGTGFRVDPAARPELALIFPHIRFWGDRFRPDPGMEHDELAESPDLADDFSFIEKQEGACPALRHVHCFNFAATLSHGKLSGDIRAVTPGVERLARGILASLFVEDAEAHHDALAPLAKRELLGDEIPPGAIIRD